MFENKSLCIKGAISRYQTADHAWDFYKNPHINYKSYLNLRMPVQVPFFSAYRVLFFRLSILINQLYYDY